MDKMSLRDRLLPALFGPTNTTRFPGSSDVPSLNLILVILYRYFFVCVVTGMFMRLPSYSPPAARLTSAVTILLLPRYVPSVPEFRPAFLSEFPQFPVPVYGFGIRWGLAECATLSAHELASSGPCLTPYRGSCGDCDRDVRCCGILSAGRTFPSLGVDCARDRWFGRPHDRRTSDLSSVETCIVHTILC
jgi:hypothetical protein